MSNRFAVLISFSLGGHTIEIHDKRYTSSCETGYDTPENFWQRHATCKLIIPVGCPVLDKRPVVERQASLAFRSPIPDANMEDGDYKPFLVPQEDAFPALAPALGFGLIGALAIADAQTLHSESEPGPLDFVSIPRYVKWWVDHGARIGEVSSDHTFTWGLS